MGTVEIQVQNTRLFPKNRGAHAYQLTGIAARCDWVLLTDGASGRLDTCLRGELTRQPKTVFVSLRSFFDSIPFFYEHVLPKITDPFVLVTGSEDVTIPHQLDARWRKFSSREREIIHRIIEDRRVIHWFAENRDESLAKMSTLPVGYVFEDCSSDKLSIEQTESRVADRPLKVFCAHRIREGLQWEPRRRASRLCLDQFKDFTTVATEELSAEDFRKQVRSHPFTVCVQGGGLDPSPKAWFSLVNGSIPIIQSSVLDDAYSQLPVAFVDDWDASCLSIEKLARWRDELSPYFDHPELRAKVLYQLSLDYWWEQITNKHKYWSRRL